MKQIEGMPEGVLESLVDSAKFIVDNKRFNRYEAFSLGLGLGRIFHADEETIRELQDWAKAAEYRRTSSNSRE